jgi:Fic family protein
MRGIIGIISAKNAGIIGGTGGKGVYLGVRRTGPYIYQRSGWPHLKWDGVALLAPLAQVRNLQGRLLGKMETLGFHFGQEASLETLTLDVLKSSEIEGELLNPDQVRSSIARRLGMDIAGLVPSDRNVDGVVEMMLDATQHFDQPLTAERLFGWQSSLFPGGRSGMYKIIVGNWRDDSTGPMQVVSGAMGHERVHYQAPDASKVDAEMAAFLAWFNEKNDLDPVLKAGIAHFWFLTIHPFEDGNGRIARALTDMLLARADGSNQRFYSMSAQIRQERREYYILLEFSQKGGLDITSWLQWFLNCMLDALESTERTLAKVLYKHQFWGRHTGTELNERQRMMLNKLFDGFEGKLTSSKWAKIAKCSEDTALRDIQDLMQKGILRKEPSGGRSTNYELV